MKYGDIVTYVGSDFETNALVYSHDAQSDAINLAFLDPQHDSQGLKPPTVTVKYGVQKLGGNVKIGWKEIGFLDHPEVKAAAAKIDTDSDLDSVAAEQKAKEATADDGITIEEVLAQAKIDDEQPGAPLTPPEKAQMVVDEVASEQAADPGEQPTAEIEVQK